MRPSFFVCPRGRDWREAERLPYEDGGIARNDVRTAVGGVPSYGYEGGGNAKEAKSVTPPLFGFGI